MTDNREAAPTGTPTTPAPLAASPTLGDPATINFAFTGGSETFTIPADVSTVRIRAIGGGGGLGAYWTNTRGFGSLAGWGAMAEAVFDVTRDQVLTIKVGGMGLYGRSYQGEPVGRGGWERGGNGGQGLQRDAFAFGGGGGGATTVVIGNDVLIVAGGGGGGGTGGTIPPDGGEAGAGGHGGNPGADGGNATLQNAQPENGRGGMGGTAIAGGAGGAGGRGSTGRGDDGAAMAGGNGATGQVDQPPDNYRAAGGGGGGAGWFGGGGGGPAGSAWNYGGGGGGGGSSWIKPGARNVVYQSGVANGHGSVVIELLGGPQVDVVPRASTPPSPEGLSASSIVDPRGTDSSTTFPVLTYRGRRIYALSFDDNRQAFAICAYDANNRLVKRWDRPGARYISTITVDGLVQTVTFVGQYDAQAPGHGTVVMTWAELAEQ